MYKVHTPMPATLYCLGHHTAELCTVHYIEKMITHSCNSTAYILLDTQMTNSYSKGEGEKRPTLA